ncbi:hypothetical protein SDC9_160959 [bioreactor metagenome]|uniref:Ice-binding protein C-terminal domain-containing protein n=1 Tax=bioreactor metagenome TaxID=1076179 RepID=A0A645FJ23_9ZZZZ|nr:PEP-CTERM sorting domain-containing protein [Dechloromonas sp. CZR5]
MNKKTKFLAALLASAAIAGNAHAALVNSALPTNTYITESGLDWAWAFPLPAAAGLDLSFQSSFGWRIPTLAELALAPDATDFMFAGANVPLHGVDPVSGAYFSATNAALTGAAACATPYFSNSYSHCDWQDGQGQPLAPWAGLQGAQGFADQLVVRNAQVPEPASIALIGLGLIGLVGSRRKAK